MAAAEGEAHGPCGQGCLDCGGTVAVPVPGPVWSGGGGMQALRSQLASSASRLLSLSQHQTAAPGESHASGSVGSGVKGIGPYGGPAAAMRAGIVELRSADAKTICPHRGSTGGGAGGG